MHRLHTHYLRLTGVEVMSQRVSNPTGFRRGVHVEWDPQAGAFKGLPKEWAAELPKVRTKCCVFFS